MPEAYEFFDHTADIGAHIYGATLQELFRNAAAALYKTLGELRKTEGGRQKAVEIRTASLEDLLHDWLAELLYEVEVNHVLHDEIASLTVRGTGGVDGTDLGNRGREAAPTFVLNANLHGGEIDFSRSQTNEEIKAVTYHQLRVEQLPDHTWRATVIFDV